MLHSLAGELKSISQMQDEEQLARLLPWGKRCRTVVLGAQQKPSDAEIQQLSWGASSEGQHTWGNLSISPSQFLKDNSHTSGSTWLSWEKPKEVQKEVQNTTEVKLRERRMWPEEGTELTQNKLPNIRTEWHDASLHLLQVGWVWASAATGATQVKEQEKFCSVLDSSAQGYSHKLLWNWHCRKLLDKALAGMVVVLLIVLGAS